MSKVLPIKIADSKIVGWQYKSGELSVDLIDWREIPIQLKFRGVVAVTAFNTEGIELSHLESSDDDALLRQVRFLDEDSTDLSAFHFVNSWDQAIVLTVIASAIETAEAQQTS